MNFAQNSSYELSQLNQIADCQSLDVVIKYYCTQSESLPFDTDEEFQRVCIDLTTQAFERYYSGEVKVGSQVYNVSIRSEVIEDAKYQHFIVAKSKDEVRFKSISISVQDQLKILFPRNAKDWVSITLLCHQKSIIAMTYNSSTQWLMNLVRMNLLSLYYNWSPSWKPISGHGILIAADGIINSATHKGTSTLDQIARPDGQIANCDGSTVFDLMHYFPKYLPNCYGKI